MTMNATRMVEWANDQGQARLAWRDRLKPQRSPAVACTDLLARFFRLVIIVGALEFPSVVKVNVHDGPRKRTGVVPAVVVSAVGLSE